MSKLTWSMATVLGGLTLLLPYPAAIETPSHVDGPGEGPGAMPDDSRRQVGKTLVPVTDPRCSLAMPTFQTYREVPISEAAGPSPCAGEAR